MITRPGVNLSGLHRCVAEALPEMEAARLVALETLQDLQMCVTSARDGEHGPRSLHDEGFAVDLRTKDFAIAWADHLRKALGVGWDVVTEADHLHVERDIRRIPLTAAEQGGVR